MSEKEQTRILSAIVDLVFPRTDNEATAFPYWYIAQKGAFGKVCAVSKGVWFSREAAELSLKHHAYRYSKSAFVYCDSAHESYSGLRQLYELAKDARQLLDAVERLPEVSE